MDASDSFTNYPLIVQSTAINPRGTSQHAGVERHMALELYNVVFEVGTSFFKARMYKEASKFFSRALDQAALLGRDQLDPHERTGL